MVCFSCLLNNQRAVFHPDPFLFLHLKPLKSAISDLFKTGYENIKKTSGNAALFKENTKKEIVISLSWRKSTNYY